MITIASTTFYSPDIQPYLDKVVCTIFYLDYFVNMIDMQFGLDSIGVAGVIMVEGITSTVTSLLAAPLVQKLVCC